ncbi:MAG TPA: hypothetical protein VEH77_12740 [Roseiarcus sp.]|nr:hypothetical protein [Roseiarcus sp.]
MGRRPRPTTGPAPDVNEAIAAWLEEACALGRAIPEPSAALRIA